MNKYTEIFYWLVVADNARIFFGWFCVISLICAVVTGIGAFMGAVGCTDPTIDTKVNFKWLLLSWPLAIIFTSLWVFTPSKKDSLLIIAGGETINFLATDSSTKQIPHELSNFVLTELKSMAKDVELDGIVKTEEQKALESIQSMSKEEILEAIKQNPDLINQINPKK